MLTVVEAIQQRRSVRSFKRTPVPDEMILEMLEAARLAPSASNSQPWRFVVVTDLEEKRELRRLCMNQGFVEEAGVDFIICADLSAFSKDAYRRQRQESINTEPAPNSLRSDPSYQKYIDSMINSMDDTDLTQQLIPATSNTYIATEHILLMATALGLGSCWVGGISDHKAVRDLFGIPRGIRVLGVVAVGYTDIESKARPRLPLDEILLRSFPTPVSVK